MEKRVHEDLEQLKNYQHILDLRQISQTNFQITYAPTQTNSVYKDQKYTLNLFIPPLYPQSPPSIQFLTKIHHLNVCPRTSTLKMNILKDEWSPFLSLISVIESLDSILEQPEQSSVANSTVLEEYQNSRQKYLQKVLNSFEENETNSTTNQLLNTNQDNKGNFKKQRMQKEDIQKKLSSQKLNFLSGQSQARKRQQQLDKMTEIISPIKKIPERSQKVQISPYEVNDGELSKKNKSMISNSLGIFIEEINQTQLQIESSQNQMLKGLLSDSLRKQINMVKQLLYMSTKAQRNMIRSVRQST